MDRNDVPVVLTIGFVLGAMLIGLLWVKSNSAQNEHLIEMGCAWYDTKTGAINYGKKPNE